MLNDDLLMAQLLSTLLLPIPIEDAITACFTLYDGFLAGTSGPSSSICELEEIQAHF